MIKLDFPPAKLSGHNTGHWRAKAGIVKQFRQAAAAETSKMGWQVQPEGDIHIHVTFYPPDRRGDRVNFPNRCKPIFDGVADALGVNDSRFLPHFYFCEPQKPGWVEVRVGT